MNTTIKLVKGTQEISFVPQAVEVELESLATENSGRTLDGVMHIDFLKDRLTKIQITLPPYKAADTAYNGILAFVQGQTYYIRYYDYTAGQNAYIKVYTGNTGADWYSGVILNGVIQGATFSAIDVGEDE